MQKRKAKPHPEDWKFFRMYANIPLPLRGSEICAVVDDEPMTFRVVYQELHHKTEAGFKALEQLIKMGVV